MNLFKGRKFRINNSFPKFNPTLS